MEKIASKIKKNPERRPVYNVTFLHYRDNILAHCDSRNDAWSETVKRRVLGCIDLVQAEAKYHDNCRVLFEIISDVDMGKEWVPRYLQIFLENLIHK